MLSCVSGAVDRKFASLECTLIGDCAVELGGEELLLQVVWIGNKSSRLRRQDVEELPLACCGAEGPAEPAYFEAEVELLRKRGHTAPCEVHLSVQTRGGTTPLGDAVLDLAEHEAALENAVVVQELALAGWPAQPGSQQPRLRVAITLCDLHFAKARASPIASIEPELPVHAKRERLPRRQNSASEGSSDGGSRRNFRAFPASASHGSR